MKGRLDRQRKITKIATGTLVALRESDRCEWHAARDKR